MLSFLVEEGVITIGTLSGIFTASMLNSFRVNIFEPIIENIIPSHKLDGFGNIENIMLLPVKQEEHSSSGAKKILKWQTFLRDLVAWLFLMILLYLFWKYIVKKSKV